MPRLLPAVQERLRSSGIFDASSTIPQIQLHQEIQQEAARLFLEQSLARIMPQLGRRICDFPGPQNLSTGHTPTSVSQTEALSPLERTRHGYGSIERSRLSSSSCDMNPGEHRSALESHTFRDLRPFVNETAMSDSAEDVSTSEVSGSSFEVRSGGVAPQSSMTTNNSGLNDFPNINPTGSSADEQIEDLDITVVEFDGFLSRPSEIDWDTELGIDPFKGFDSSNVAAPYSF